MCIYLFTNPLPLHSFIVISYFPLLQSSVQDQSRSTKLEGAEVSIRRKRSQVSRRPRPQAQSLPNQSPMSSRPLSDFGDANNGEKTFNVSQNVSKSVQVNGIDMGPNVFPSNGASGDGTRSENNLKTVKLKMGGVTHIIQPKCSSNWASSDDSLAKTSQSLDNAQLQHRLIPQEHSDECHYPPPNKKNVLQGVPWKDFSEVDFGFEREYIESTIMKNAFENQGEKSDSVCKSERAPKRRVLEAEFDEDTEIRYLEKLKTSKMIGYKGLEADSVQKPHKSDKFGNAEDVGRSSQDVRKSRSRDSDYEENESLLDDEAEGKSKKKQNKDLYELPTKNKREMVITTRQRALLIKDTSSSASGANPIEFPNGLPPATPRIKQKEKLTEVEQQQKKVEAAERRRLQNEKSEAEAIRKILGQESSRKKKEILTKKRQEEFAKEKETTAQMLKSNTIRTVIGPSGTTVTFPLDMGLPSLFDVKSSSYPPPREKCAGPSCNNPYKYRDSKTKVPLCSLQCYKAVNEKTHHENDG